MGQAGPGFQAPEGSLPASLRRTFGGGLGAGVVVDAVFFSFSLPFYLLSLLSLFAFAGQTTRSQKTRAGPLLTRRPTAVVILAPAVRYSIAGRK
jgi:hypothetical protein